MSRVRWYLKCEKGRNCHFEIFKMLSININSIITSCKSFGKVLWAHGSTIMESFGKAVSSLIDIIFSLRDCLTQGLSNTGVFGRCMGSLLISHAALSLCPHFVIAIVPFGSVLAWVCSIIFSFFSTHPGLLFLAFHFVGLLISPGNTVQLGEDLASFLFNSLKCIHSICLLFVDLFLAMQMLWIATI